MASQNRSVSSDPEHGANIGQNSAKDMKLAGGDMLDTNPGKMTQGQSLLPPSGWDAPGTFLHALRRIPLDQAQLLLNRSFQLGLSAEASIKDLVGYGTGLAPLSPYEIFVIAGYAGLTGTGSVLPNGASSGAPEGRELGEETNALLDGSIALTRFPPPWGLDTGIGGHVHSVALDEAGTPDSTEQTPDFKELEETTQMAIISDVLELDGDGTAQMAIIDEVLELEGGDVTQTAIADEIHELDGVCIGQMTIVDGIHELYGGCMTHPKEKVESPAPL